MLKAEEILNIYGMSTIDRAILLFQSFPGKLTYFEEVFETLRNARRGVNFHYIAENAYAVEIYTKGLGTFRMHWEEINIVTEENGYRFSFSILDRLGNSFISKGFDKAKADILSSRVVPFMLSKGNCKKDIPLIIHDFPEFAKYALEFTP